MSKFWFHKLLCRLNYEDRRICNYIIGQLVLKHCVLWNYENIEMTKNHRHLINIDCLLTQPACLPLLTVVVMLPTTIKHALALYAVCAY